jgi:YHS domain-containing protein
MQHDLSATYQRTLWFDKSKQPCEIIMTIERTFKALLLTAALALSACAPLITQSPNEGWRPVNVKPAPEAGRLLIDGYDVVAFFTENKARPGSAAIRSDYKGVSLYFVSAENKSKFDADPQAYLPQYGGYCANGIVYGIPWGGDGNSYRIFNGKLYMFGGIGSVKGFELDVPGNIALADKYWKEEVEGSNAFLQRVKRSAFARVPHYRTGPELAALVAEKERAGK